MSEAIEKHGKCLCGAVEMTLQVPANEFGACHCDMCRRWCGGPLLVLEGTKAVVFEGQESIGVYESSEWAERGFCKQCGSGLFFRLKKDGEYYIPLGLIDDDAGMTFESEVFIDEKPEYYSFANHTKTMTGAELFALFGGENT